MRVSTEPLDHRHGGCGCVGACHIRLVADYSVFNVLLTAEFDKLLGHS